MLVLRPEGQAEDLAAGLAELGAEPVVVPAIRILPPASWDQIDDALSRMEHFDWIAFTSVNGVQYFMKRLLEKGYSSNDLPGKVAAIGPATKRALQEQGAQVEWFPASYTTASMAEEFPMSYEPGGRAVCLVRADIATSDLEDLLKARGFNVERVDAYRTERGSAEALRAAAQNVDAVALTSASIVGSFAEAAGQSLPQKVAIFSIGPATTKACEEYGMAVSSEARQHTIKGVLHAMANYGWQPQ